LTTSEYYCIRLLESRTPLNHDAVVALATFAYQDPLGTKDFAPALSLVRKPGGGGGTLDGVNTGANAGALSLAGEKPGVNAAAVFLRGVRASTSNLNCTVSTLGLDLPPEVDDSPSDASLSEEPKTKLARVSSSESMEDIFCIGFSSPGGDTKSGGGTAKSGGASPGGGMNPSGKAIMCCKLSCIWLNRTRDTE